MLRSNVNRLLSGLLVLILVTGLTEPVSGVFGNQSGSALFGEPISGNIVTADEAENGFRWNGDSGVTLSEGSLWWDQFHNPLTRLSVVEPEKPNGFITYTSISAGDSVTLTSGEETEYIYYRTVGMRFTLENVLPGEDAVSTYDIGHNPKVWDRNDVKFVDVFLDDASETVRTRVSNMLSGGPTAGGRRLIGNSVMHTKDITNSNVIESHYCIENFLKRDEYGRIMSESVVGQLINLRCGSDSLPTGEWRIYASHIIEIMTATRVKQPNGQIILKDRRERLVEDSRGNLVPDVRTTLADSLEAANWSSATRDEFIPSLFNRFLDLKNEDVVSTTIVVRYYISGQNPRSSVVRTVFPKLEELMPARFGTVNISYKKGYGSKPENLYFDPGEEFERSIECDSFGGIEVYSGCSPDVYGINTDTTSPYASFLTRFSLFGNWDNLYLTPVSALIGSEKTDITTPYICIWVPLKSQIQVSVMYVTEDDKKPVLVRDGGYYPVDAGSAATLSVPSSVLTGTKVKEELSDPLKTADGAEYVIDDSNPDKTVRYFVGTDGWNCITGKENTSADSIKSPDRTVRSLSLTGEDGDGRKYGVTVQGVSENVRIPAGPYATDVVFFVKVTKKRQEIPLRNLYIRYVPSSGASHILKDIGPISIPAGTDYVYEHRPGTVEYAGAVYEPVDDPYGAERPLLGVWTTEGRLPRAYSTVTAGGNDLYKIAVTNKTADGKYKITIPENAKEAMLFIPFTEKETVTGNKSGAEINIYYIKGSRAAGYSVLMSEKKILGSGAKMQNGAYREFAVRKDFADPTGAHWSPMTYPGLSDYDYIAITSATAQDSLGEYRYPKASGEPGWTKIQHSVTYGSDSMYIGVTLSEDVVYCDIFVPCEIKTGNNPVRFFAIDANTGQKLMPDPIATSFMSTDEDLIDISDREEISVHGKSYVMVGDILERKNVYPYVTTAYAYAGFATQAVPSFNPTSTNIVCPEVFFGDATQTGTDVREESNRRYVYLKVSGLGIPSGNIIAVYIPFRAASSVNIFLVTEENKGTDPTVCAVSHISQNVSRSYWFDTCAVLEPDNNKEGAGWFEFEVPTEVEDTDGTIYSLSDEDPVAIHHDVCCGGSLRDIGLCAVKCPLCTGTGFMTAHGRAGLYGAKEKCSFCNGMGVWVTAMNYNIIPRSEALWNPGTAVKKKCTYCDGSGFDPTLSSHAHEKQNCPECNSNGRGPTTVCPTCHGAGKVIYATWDNGTGIDANGNVVVTSVRVYKEKECGICHGSGGFPCRTCDGSGKVDGDICMHCFEERFYTVGTDEAMAWRPVYGTGYTVERREICYNCGGKGYSICGNCGGTGWSTERGTNGQLLPCRICGGIVTHFGARTNVQRGRGEIACYCNGYSFKEDPDPADYDRTYSRGRRMSYTDSEGNTTTTREKGYFMWGGYYCDDCNTYILEAGVPNGGTLVLQNYGTSDCKMTVYGASSISDEERTSLFGTSYRKVDYINEPLGKINNYEACFIETNREFVSYDAAKADLGHRTQVIKLPSCGDKVQRMRVFIPNDSGTKGTDVYILYTGWQPFPMPGPEPVISEPEPYAREPDIIFTDTDTDSCDISIVAGYNRGIVYDPSLSIPSGRDVKLKAVGKKYLYDMKICNVTGMAEVPVTVRYPYAIYESAASFREDKAPKESGFIEKTVIVRRPYSYWAIDKLAVWVLNEAGAISNVFSINDTGYERISARPGNQATPYFTAVRLGDIREHLTGLPPSEGIVVTVPECYVDICKNGVLPEIPILDEGYARRMAYEAFPELKARDDTLIFDGITILSGLSSESMSQEEAIVTGNGGFVSQLSSWGNGKTPGPTGNVPPNSGLLTFYSAEKKIPVKKHNETYPVLAATFSYSRVPVTIGFADETKYRSTGIPEPVTVHTPVYVKGTLSMTYGGTSGGFQGIGNIPEQSTGQGIDPNAEQNAGQGLGQVSVTGTNNITYVQQKDADTSLVWAVLGEERDYEGYDGNAPAQTFCTSDIYASLTNRADAEHPHLSHPGYGIKKYDEDIYTPDVNGLPYNRVSFDIGVKIDRSFKEGKISWEPDFIENSADLTLDAGEFYSVPADTVFRIIIPRDTPEGRHTITFVSVATNKDKPDVPLETAMHYANRYYLSHAAYDRLYFEVTGRLWGLKLEGVRTESGEKKSVGVGDRSAAGLVLRDPPDGFFPAAKDDGVLPGVTAKFSLMSTGIVGNTEAASGIPGAGLMITPTVLFVPFDGKTGKLTRDEAVEAELWYDAGPYTGRSGLIRFEPKVNCFVPSGEAAAEERFTADLFIPAGLKVAQKGSMENLPKGVGVNSRADKWLTGGLLVVRFDISLSYEVDDRIVTLGYDCGPADMWELEGYRQSREFRKGDVLLIDPGSDIRDRYIVDHLN